ncbi:hypothetical protein [Nocardia niigatensis]
MSWEYKASEFYEAKFTMSLGFEESLTLDALRAFVAATEHLNGDHVVEIGSAHRAGHEDVVTITARRGAGECSAIDGPQPEDDLDAEDDGENRPYDPDLARDYRQADEAGAL